MRDFSIDVNENLIQVFLEKAEFVYWTSAKHGATLIQCEKLHLSTRSALVCSLVVEFYCGLLMSLKKINF